MSSVPNMGLIVSIKIIVGNTSFTVVKTTPCHLVCGWSPVEKSFDIVN